jgi:hypothetical protein
MTRKGWQREEWALAIAATCSLLAFWGLEVWFLKISPKSKDPALGAIYPIDWHWTTIFVTAVQELASNTLFWGAVVLFLVALIIELRIKLFRE